MSSTSSSLVHLSPPKFEMKHCFDNDAYLNNFFLLLSADLKSHAESYRNKKLCVQVQPPPPFEQAIECLADSLEQLKMQVAELVDQWDWGTKKRSKRGVREN